MANILVTGGCGFIGSHLCAALVARGDTVRVLDDLSTGLVTNLAPGATLMIGDAAQVAALREAFVGMDGCYHLAAVASVERGVRDPVGSHRTNLSAAVALFDVARHAGVPVVYASSAAVYGASGLLPLHEAGEVRPLSAYGADKLGCELHARVAGHVHGLRTTGLRFFNVFGPRQDPTSPYSGVISIFCDRLLRGEPLDIFGDGLQSRDFIFVEDVVRALLAAMPRASADAPILNVCTGRATSILHLASLTAGLCDAVPEIRHHAARAGEIRHSVGSNALSRAELRLGQCAALRDGLDATLTWMREGRPGLARAAPARPAVSRQYATRPAPAPMNSRQLSPASAGAFR